MCNIVLAALVLTQAMKLLLLFTFFDVVTSQNSKFLINYNLGRFVEKENNF